MRILCIRIKNLASLDGTTEIDFTAEPLQSAGIFAITGPTGAGKSTILDALCLALYAKTPRYISADRSIDIADVRDSTIKQDDVRGILRDGTAEGFAEVDFASTDGQHYRARWSVRRARGKVDGKLQAYEMSLSNILTNQPLPGRKTELLEEIERLVGLNFEQFTRSVLLAQGDFSAFLKAGTNDKAALLEKLTGTQIYSQISVSVYEHFKREKILLEKLDERRQGIETFTGDELKEMAVKREELTNEKNRQDAMVTALTREKNWHRRYAELAVSEEEAGLKLAKTLQMQAEAQAGKEHLMQVERVQPARPLLIEQAKAEKLYAETKESVEELFLRLSAMKAAKEAAELAKNSAEADWSEKKNLRENAKPVLDAAKKLDAQLEEKIKQVQSAEKEMGDAQRRLAARVEELSGERAALDGLNREIGQLTAWIDERRNKKQVAENERYIIGKLEDAQSHLAKYAAQHSRLETARAAIGKLTIGKTELSDKGAALMAKIEEKRSAVSALDAEVRAIPIARLEQEKQQVDASVEELIGAAAHWDKLLIVTEEAVKMESELKKAKHESSELEIAFAGSVTRLDSLKLLRDASSKSLERARIAATENVGKLREQLVDDEPCPVCGSTRHPFKTGDKPLDRVLKTLEEEHRKRENEYAGQLETHIRLEQQLRHCKETAAVRMAELPGITRTLLALRQQWTQFAVFRQADGVAEADRAGWLQRQRKEQKSRQAALQREIGKYKQLKERLENESAALRNLESEWNLVSNQLKDIDRDIEAEEMNIRATEKEEKTAHAALENIKTDLAGYFITESWFDHWQHAPEQFIRNVAEFAAGWRDKNQLLEAGRHRQGVLEARVKALQKQSEELKNNAADKLRTFNEIRVEWKTIDAKRKTLFGGKRVREVEEELEKEVSVAGVHFEAKEKALSEMLRSVIRLEAQWKQTESDKSKWETEVSQSQSRVREWLSEHNTQYGRELSPAELRRLLTFSHTWIETQREELRKIDDEVTNTRSAFAERQKDRTIHLRQRISEKEEPEVDRLLAEAQHLSAANQKEINQLAFAVEEDEKKKQTIAGLLEEIGKQQRVADDWAKLNELIGSADGKKFRQVAQEYTLDLLLGYANVHLAFLDRRYALQRTPHSLAMQVIDRDMGDEVRTVYSLSGGETFLVSLALALGLASLSSNRIRVETLFIDEGFGSLDSTTLNIAMDALERLYNQGRKVGVISHVPEMAERIPVQIRVSKQQSGKSRVEVV